MIRGEIMTKRNKSFTSKKNAKLSTGPRSIVGKTIVKSNGVSHGISSLQPVIRGEKNEDWEAHRLGIIESSAPCGPLEVELAERVALLTWRLRRVVRFETLGMGGYIPIADKEGTRTPEIIRQEQDVAQGRYRDLIGLQEGYHQIQTMWEGDTFNGPLAVKVLIHTRDYLLHREHRDFDVTDSKFLFEMGVPVEWQDKLKSWDGWTTGILMKGIAAIAEKGDMTAEELVEKAALVTKKGLARCTARMKRLEEELTGMRRKEKMKNLRENDSPRDCTPVMDQTVLDKVIRYENHLSKQLLVALDLLRRLQAHRLRCSREEGNDEGLPTLEETGDSGNQSAPGAVVVELQG
jgi:hypothetical protein